MENEGVSRSKIEIDHGNYFIEYFYIIGLNQDLIFQEFLYENDFKTINESEKIRPHLISKFPDVNRSIMSIDNDIVIQHCFPHGLIMLEGLDKTPQSEVFCFTLDNLAFINTYPKIYYNCLLFYESNVSYFNIKEKYFGREDTIETVKLASIFFIPKVICLASLYPFHSEKNKILEFIHSYVFTNTNNNDHNRKPLEKVIENLILETPVPPKGCLQVEYSMLHEKMILAQSPVNSLPITSLELELIFSHLKVDSVLDVLRCIVLEIQVVFFSTDKYILSSVIEGFMTLLYPFKYAYPNITIIPLSNLPLIEISSTSIFGINFAYSDCFFMDFHIQVIQKSFLIVDLDHQEVINHVPSYSNMDTILLKNLSCSEQINFIDPIATTDLPKHYKIKLVNKIKNYLKTNDKLKEYKENFNITMQNAFFYFMISIIHDYSRYLLFGDQDIDNINTKVHDKQKMNIRDMLKTEEYLLNCYSLDQPFYRKFFETKLFFNFIYRKLFPKDIKDTMEVLYIDESIIIKKNKNLFTKSMQTPFISSNIFDVKSNYIVPKTKGFSTEEIEYMKDPNVIRLGLKYGQELRVNHGHITVYYEIFPKLLYDNFFFGVHYNDQYVRNKIYFPTSFGEEIESKCNEILALPNIYNIYSGSNYNFNLSRKLNNMENYIYLCWIEIFALTFWYCDQPEKPFRSEEMYSILNRIEWMDEEVLYIVLISLVRYGDDEMMIMFYEHFSHLGIVPNYTAFACFIHKLSNNRNCLQQNKKGGSFVYSRRSTTCLKSQEQISYYDPDYLNLNINPRTIASKLDDTESEEIQFESEYTCVECLGSFDLSTICLQFNKMNNELLWGICPLCNLCIMPKMNVKFGNAVNEDRIDRFALYSPYYLKYYYSIALLTECEFKLDVEGFRRRFNPIFWNSIWYFSLLDLPFDFILPYKLTHKTQNFNIKHSIYEKQSQGDMYEKDNFNFVANQKEQLNLNFNNMELSISNTIQDMFSNLEVVSEVNNIFIKGTIDYFTSTDEDIRSSFIEMMSSNNECTLDFENIKRKYYFHKKRNSRRNTLVHRLLFASFDLKSKVTLLNDDKEENSMLEYFFRNLIFLVVLSRIEEGSH